MGFRKNVSLEDALDSISKNVHPLDAVTVPVDGARGYVFAKTVYASEDIPPFDRAAMDGYALASQDTASITRGQSMTLSVVSDIHPSTDKPPPIQRGQAARIMTGGPIPPGADAVVRDEDVQNTAGDIHIHSPVSCSQFVSRKGQDLKKGDLIASQGAVVQPVDISLLASSHVRKVIVTRKPTVAILSIGNELIDLKESPQTPKIVASNCYMLSAMIEKQGYQVGFSTITQNTEDAIGRDLEEGLKKDIVITIGGTAHAKSDLTRAVLEATGVRIQFAGVAMRPGKGTTFGMVENKPVFALPGTPSSVFTAFYSFVLPALWRLCGHRDVRTETVQAILEKSIRKQPGITHMVQGVVTEKASLSSVLPLTGPGIAKLSAMAKANGLIRISPDEGNLVKGQPVSVQLLDRLGPTVFTHRRSSRAKGEQRSRMPAILSVVGKSNAGKTTFLEKLVPELIARGHKIGTIKHDVHGFDLDHEGKDSWRHKQAGAHTVVISSPRKVGVIKDVPVEETLDSLAVKYFQEVDLVLTEGYKRQGKPKIEVFRRSAHAKPLCKSDDNLIAIVSDTPLDWETPCFGLDDISGVADFVEKLFLER
jgi:molybdopterin molybdotransferase